MSVRTVRSVRSLQALNRSLHSSSTAPNPSHLLSTSRDSVHSHYASLTVNVLKQECRTRGLKINGRKTELVDRIVGFEQSKAFSTAAAKPAHDPAAQQSNTPPNAKSFTTSSASMNPAISKVGLPRVAPTKEELKSTTVKVPVKAENINGPELQANYTKRSISTDPGAALGDVHVVDGAPKVSTMNVDLGDGAPTHDEERTGTRGKDSLSSRDKSFLTVLGGVIVGWWYGDNFLKSKNSGSSATH